MRKTAILFPGQGAQFVGMGKDFYDNFSESRAIYEEASDIIGLNIKKICFEENEKIDITEYTQAAILTTSMAMFQAWKKEKLPFNVSAGLSLGEYNALVACGVMQFQDAIRVVRERGILMQEAVLPGEGAMIAILGLEKEKIEEILSSFEGVQIANYNCPGQLVISGRTNMVMRAAERMKEAGARRCVQLKVSGPFHSILLKSAGEKLAKVLESIKLKQPEVPYVANVTAEYVMDTKKVKTLLQQQVSSSVRWQQSVEVMLAEGVEQFIEIGPGKTLSEFVKKIDKWVKVYHIETVNDLKVCHFT